MDILELLDDVEKKLTAELAKLPRVTADKVGLDKRAGRVWVDADNGILITGKPYADKLSYFGGFQYVDGDSISVIGDFVIYHDGDDRVFNAIEYWEDNHATAEA